MDLLPRKSEKNISTSQLFLISYLKQLKNCTHTPSPSGYIYELRKQQKKPQKHSLFSRKRTVESNSETQEMCWETDQQPWQFYQPLSLRKETVAAHMKYRKDGLDIKINRL